MWIKTYQNILVNFDNMDIITIRQRDDQNVELCEIAAYYDNESKSVAIKQFDSIAEAKESFKNLKDLEVEF